MTAEGSAADNSGKGTWAKGTWTVVMVRLSREAAGEGKSGTVTILQHETWVTFRERFSCAG